jgi:hypothetical protein
MVHSSWVHGFMVHGFMSSWVHGFMSSSVHGASARHEITKSRHHVTQLTRGAVRKRLSSPQRKEAEATEGRKPLFSFHPPNRCSTRSGSDLVSGGRWRADHPCNETGPAPSRPFFFEAGSHHRRRPETSAPRSAAFQAAGPRACALGHGLPGRLRAARRHSRLSPVKNLPSQT